MTFNHGSMGSSPITYIAETQRNYKTFNMEDKTMACCKGNEKLPFQMEGNVPVKAIAVEAPVADTKTKLIVHDGVISAGFFSEGVPIGGVVRLYLMWLMFVKLTMMENRRLLL